MYLKAMELKLNIIKKEAVSINVRKILKKWTCMLYQLPSDLKAKEIFQLE